MEIISHSSEETRELGKHLGKRAFSSMLVAFQGDLGAGKTEFVKGFCKGLGCEQATSPTFPIMNVYEGGRLTVYHFDFYRCHGDIQEFEEYLYGDGVALVEWSQLVDLPEDRLTVEIGVLGESKRRFRFLSGSPKYEQLIKECYEP